MQQAWDKHANFLKSQARAQGELRGLIRQYDELLHENWDLATAEQTARIEVLKSQVIQKDENKEQAKDWKAAIIEIAKRRSEKADGGTG